MKNLKPLLGLVLIVGLCSFNPVNFDNTIPLNVEDEVLSCVTTTPYGTEIEPARISFPTITYGEFGCVYSIEFYTLGGCTPYVWNVTGDVSSFHVTSSGASSSVLIYPDGNNLTGGTLYVTLNNSCGGYVGRKVVFCCVS